MDRPIHEELWLRCATKRCCTLRTVLPTSADIWRIATSLQIAPESFLRPIPAHDHPESAFALDRTGRLFHAALVRRSLKGGAAACVFLLQLGSQAARCGLGSLRPTTCQSFPATGSPGMVRVDDQHPCTCRAWTLADLDRAQISELLRQDTSERQGYHASILAWNAQVGAAPGERGFSFGDFCHFMMSTYAQHATQPEPRGQA